MARLAQHAQERHAPPDGQLLRYADGRPITHRRYDHLWDRIGRHLPWVAEVAGLALGTSESKGEEYRVRAQAVAELCCLAGADEPLIPGWIDEGRRRVNVRRKPPFSDPAMRAPRRP